MLFAVKHHQQPEARTPQPCLASWYRKYAVTLTRIAILKGADINDAEELVQELFVKLQRYDYLSALENEEAFLRTMLSNLITDRFRKTQRMPQIVDIDSIEPVQASKAYEPECQYKDNNEVQWLMQDLQSLPNIARDVFLSHRIEHLSYETIAKQNHITVAAVRKHLRDTLIILTTKRVERGSDQ